MLFRTGMVGRFGPCSYAYGMGGGGGTGPGGVEYPPLDLDFMTPGVLDPRIVFTRGSIGTYYDVAGVLQTAGVNLVTNSQAVNSWPTKTDITVVDNSTVSPDGTTNASLVTEGSAGTATLTTNIPAVAASATVSYSVHLKRGNTDWLRILGTDNGTANGFNGWVNLATGASSFTVRGTATAVSGNVIPLTNGWYRLVGTATLIGTSSLAQLTINSASGSGSATRVNNATYYVWGGQIELGPTATQYAPTTTAANSSPRWDYDPVTHALRGLLIEEQRQNIALQSGNMTVSWGLSGATAVGAAGVAPDGTTTMTRFVETAATSAHGFFSAPGTVASTVYTCSLFAKAAEVRYLMLRFDDGGPNLVQATFDLQTGTISTAASAGGTGASPAAAIQAVGNGIYRCSVTGSIGAVTTGRFIPCLSNTGSVVGFPTYAGNVANGLLVWGGSIEAGAFPTSYIPTTTVAVVRQQDSLVMLTNPTWYNTQAGSTLATITFRDAPPTGLRNSGVYSIDDGTQANLFHNLGATGSGGSVTPVHGIQQSSTNIAYNNWGGISTLGAPFTNFAASWSTTTALLSPNGGAAISSAVTGVLPTVTRLQLGIGGGGTLALGGWYRKFQYWPRTMSATELQNVSAIGPALDLSFTTGVLDSRITFTRASIGTYFDNAGVLQTAGNNVPRFDYDPITHVMNGLLIEEQRQNLLWPSSDFTGGVRWLATNSTVSPGIAGAPDGTATFTRVSETAATGFHFVQQNLFVAASTAYAVSMFAKAAEVRYMQLSFDSSNNGGYATFDLVAGTVSGAATALGTGVVSGASIQSVGKGIYRCTLITTLGPNTAGRFICSLSNVATPSAYPSYAGNVANGLSLWGADIEAGTFPTSYIPTTAAAVTRSADVATMPTAAWFNASTSSLAADFMVMQSPNPSVNVRDTCALSDTSAANRLILRAQGISNNVAVFGTSIASTTTFSGSVGVAAAGAVSKIAATWNGTTGVGSLNGAATVSYSVGMPATLTTLTIGNDFAGAGTYLNGYVQRVRYWPRALTNAELQQVTT